MHTIRRFLVATMVPALILSIFAVGGAAANGSSGKVELCHWASHKFVEISVSMSAKPAHLRHGDVEADEYGDCAADTDEDRDEDTDEDRDEDRDEDTESREGSEHAGGNHGSSHGSDKGGNERDD